MLTRTKLLFALAIGARQVARERRAASRMPLRQRHQTPVRTEAYKADIAMINTTKITGRNQAAVMYEIGKLRMVSDGKLLFMYSIEHVLNQWNIQLF